MHVVIHKLQKRPWDPTEVKLQAVVRCLIWKPEPGLLQEHQVFLSSEPPPHLIFKMHLCFSLFLFLKPSDVAYILFNVGEALHKP